MAINIGKYATVVFVVVVQHAIVVLFYVLPTQYSDACCQALRLSERIIELEPGNAMVLEYQALIGMFLGKMDDRVVQDGSFLLLLVE